MPNLSPSRGEEKKRDPGNALEKCPDLLIKGTPFDYCSYVIRWISALKLENCAAARNACRFKVGL